MKTTILIINYNSVNYTKELVKDIKNFTNKDYEILVVDNLSPNKDEIKELKKIKGIKLLPCPENNGITGGVNFGLKHIKTPYTLLLNPDIRIEKNALTELLKTLNKDKKSFCVGGAIYHYKTKKLYALGGSFNFTTGIAKPLKKFTEIRKLNKGEYLDACILLFKTDLFKRFGYDEKFFMYAETEDVIFKARQKGYNIYSNPNAKCYHHVYGSSGGKKSPFVTYYITRNKFYLLRKHLSKLGFLKFLLINLLLVSPIQLSLFVLKRHTNLIPAFIKGTIDGIKNKTGKSF